MALITTKDICYVPLVIMFALKKRNCPSGIEPGAITKTLSMLVNGVLERRSIQQLSDNLLHSGVQLVAYNAREICREIISHNQAEL